MVFSIIIVNYNTKNLAKKCLNSIFANCSDSDFEIIVIDNDSRDGSVEMLNNEFGAKIKLIINKNNIGFGPANNQGARIAQGKYLFFLNSDTLIKENILTPLNSYLKNHEQVAIASPKLLLDNGDEQEYAYGKFPTLFRGIAEKFKKFKIDKKAILEVDWVSGAALIVRKDVFQKVKSFDEKFFMYFEDIDLCKCIKNLNYKIVVFPQVAIIHLGGKSISKFKKRKEYYYKSQNYFYKKHYGRLKMNIMRLIRWPYKIIKLF